MKFTNFLKKLIKNKHLENQITSDDIFLISFPRSGNTWIRFSLSLLHPSGIDLENNIHSIIPNLDQNPCLEKIPKPRVIKTHSPYNKDFHKVIYLLRDGRDSIYSYYEFSKKEFGYKDTFLNFLKSDHSKCYGVRWHEHVESWLGKNHENEILLIRYEDLLTDFQGKLYEILLFCGWDVNQEKLNTVYDKTTLPSMKKREQSGMSLAHVGKGQSNRWTNCFSQEELDIFLEDSRSTLIKFGYLK